MNDKWVSQFISGTLSDITLKELTIKDFAVYMNVDKSADGGYWTPKLFDDITIEWREKDNDRKY